MYQIIVDSSREQADELSDWFEEMGSVSVTFTDKEDEPILEPAPGTTPLWKKVVVTALYAEKSEALQTQYAFTDLYPKLKIQLEQVEDKEWTRAWMDQFSPMKFGERLWICPSWQEPPDVDAVNLILDPGLAFGTGTHQTTSLCLTWLDQADIQNKSLLDFGCGSGILALAALKLGVSHAYAVDIDPQALTATTNNARENQIDENRLAVGFPKDIQIKTDVVIANILLKPLLELKHEFVSLLKPKGRLVVSGILKEQRNELISHYDDLFAVESQHSLDDWALIELQLK